MQIIFLLLKTKHLKYNIDIFQDICNSKPGGPLKGPAQHSTLKLWG